jgi:hypothetical protein
MKKFGQIKNKFFSKMLESYTTNKKDVTKLMNIINEDKNFKELYLLYEKVENQYFKDKETAIQYVNELSSSLKGKNKLVSETLKKLDNSIGDIETKYFAVYDSLDSLLEEDNLLNIESKVRAKIDLVEHLTSKKDITESGVPQNFSQNENLLHSVLVNNFNVLYNHILSEEEKEDFKNIVAMSDDDIKTKTEELKENIISKVNNLLSESLEIDFLDKLQNVKDEVIKTTPSKYGYYKLKELKKGLD